MTESLVLFDSIVNSRWFLRASVILFMNKMDLFRYKVPRVRVGPGANVWRADGT